MATACNKFVEIVRLLRLMATRTAFVRFSLKCFAVSWWFMPLNQLVLGPIQRFLLSEREDG